MSYPMSLEVPRWRQVAVAPPPDPDPDPEPTPGLPVVIASTAAALDVQLRLTAAASVELGGTVTALAAGEHVVSTTGNRSVNLLVTPWSACEVINLGYSGGDGGDDGAEYIADNLPHHPTQAISAITGLTNATAMRHLLVSETALTALDCGGCAALERIEAFHAYDIAEVNLTGCTALRRPCFEDCAIVGPLDLSASLNLRDIRGTGNFLTSIVFPADRSRIWHWCTMGNSFAGWGTNFEALTGLRQAWLSYSQIGGTVRVRSGMLGSLWLDGCTAVTTIDIAGQMGAANYEGVLLAAGCTGLTAVDVSNCPGLRNGDFRNCALTEALVDGILAALVAAGGDTSETPRTLNMSGGTSSTPSATGLANVTTLRGRGWTVNHN